MSTRIVVDLVCTFVACGSLLYVLRVRRAHAELVQRHRGLLEARSSEREEFAARVAHDVLSPLQTVALALELGDRDARMRKRAQAALQRVKVLVGGFLELSRAGGRPPPDARADVSAAIGDLVEELKPDAAAVGARLSVLNAAGAAIVRCNAGVLTSLVANLMRNAIKYAGRGADPRIIVRVSSRGPFVRVEVEDTGPGLPAKLVEHVFEPHARADGTKAAGFGLGLATVKRLAEAHGGAVGVESTPGKGCTFWFTLPKADASPRDPAPEMMLPVAS